MVNPEGCQRVAGGRRGLSGGGDLRIAAQRKSCTPAGVPEGSYVEVRSGTPAGCAAPTHGFRWSFPPCPERPPATLCQPSRLAGIRVVGMFCGFIAGGSWLRFSEGKVVFISIRFSYLRTQFDGLAVGELSRFCKIGVPAKDAKGKGRKVNATDRLGPSGAAFGSLPFSVFSVFSGQFIDPAYTRRHAPS